MKTHKYRDSGELVKAFISGELDKTKYMVRVDNDQMYLDLIDREPMNDDEIEECDGLFEGGTPFDEIVSILLALGIEADYV